MRKKKNSQRLTFSSGTPLPFGVTRYKKGHNFSIFSPDATTVLLEIFLADKEPPVISCSLISDINRTGDVWHILIQDLPEQFFYSYRIDGKGDSEKGILFDFEKRLLDPYTKAISGLEKWGVRTPNHLGLLNFYSESEYNWEGDRPINRALDESIIYELHVRGFTQSQSCQTSYPGTYKGVTEQIDYLQSLGITAIELLPIHDFDELDCPFISPKTGVKHKNTWGYSSLNFFALKTGYAQAETIDGAIHEFKDMVKALHKAGIEIILDVVFNHTAEGGEEGEIFSFKGIANNVYYLLENGRHYKNYSGCGNTLNCNHPVVRSMILDSLRYWVTEMHIDGFRFDLASILSRDEEGHVLPNPPLLEAIAKDPVLAQTKIIAEAWDAAGLYQVGSFPASKRWSEWNGKYRDIIKMFCKGIKGITGEVATRISGSEDLYKHSDRNPYHSINFITAHDGFSMMDMVSYQQKHNLENGENNRDGLDENFSLNFGIEGETSRSDILSSRLKQIRNMATILMLSQGTPMLLAGDEFGKTQKGNNNAWCQDNEIFWIDWTLLEENQTLFKFWQKLIEFRKKHPMLRRTNFFTGKINSISRIADISWHNTNAYQPDFHTSSRSLAFLIDGMENDTVMDEVIYVAMNFSDAHLNFELPAVFSNHPWKEVLSTSAPDDFLNSRLKILPERVSQVSVKAFSILVLTKAY